MSLNASLISNCKAETEALASWWLEFAVDEQGGGFYGQISYDNTVKPQADKCIILHTRVLWFFSELAWVYRDTPSRMAVYKRGADHAYQFLASAFHDTKNGGFYWAVSSGGHLVDGRKHTYAQSFAIYALSAYFKLTENAQALVMAKTCFDRLEHHALDRQHGGYFEAFSQNWQPQEDVRLSQKEQNHPKTMNTHLHLLEGYTGLLDSLNGVNTPSADVQTWGALVCDRLSYVLDVYCNKIVDVTTGHIKMFLTNEWQDCSTHHSFGHDIESSWLVRKALKVLQHASFELPKGRAQFYEECASSLAKNTLARGYQAQGLVLDEVEIKSGHQSHTAWWVQMEAMVGFAYQWQASTEVSYLHSVKSIWQYTLDHYKDNEHGEWHWFSSIDVPFESSEYKTGAWKAPYHAGRTFIELVRVFEKEHGEVRQ